MLKVTTKRILASNTNIEFAEDVKFTCDLEVQSGPQEVAKITDVSPPVYPKRFVILQIASETEGYVDITFTGNCRPFQSELAAKKIPVKRLKRNATDMYFENFYTLLEYKVDTQAKRDFILKDIVENAFHGCPVVMQIGGEGFTGTALQLLEALKEMPQIFY